MTDSITTIDRKSLQTEYVSGGTGLYGRQVLRSLPWAFDDLMQDFGDDIYDRMLLDPTPRAVVNVFKASVLEEGVRLDPSIKDPKADGHDLAQEIAQFCASVLGDLVTPQDDVLWDLLDAIAYGSRTAEQVYTDVSAKTYALPGTSPVSRTQDLLILSALKPKPRRSTAFVVDAFMNVQGIVGQQPGQGYGPILGTIAVSDAKNVPNLLQRDRFAVLSFRPINGDPRGSTILRPAYTPWWTKQQAMQEFLKYLAQFASASIYAIASEAATKEGIKVANGDGTFTNTPATTVLLDMLLAFQNGTAAAFPYDTLLDTLQVSGEGGAFHNAFTFCDQQITIAILHQTRATMEAQHGSRADSETGQDILDTVIRQAKRAVCTMLRRDVLTLLVSYNYGPAAARLLTPSVSLGSVEQQDFAKFALAVAALSKSGYLDPSQYAGVDEKLGLPPRSAVPEATAAADEADDEADADDDQEDTADESV